MALPRMPSTIKAYFNLITNSNNEENYPFGSVAFGRAVE